MTFLENAAGRGLGGVFWDRLRQAWSRHQLWLLDSTRTGLAWKLFLPPLGRRKSEMMVMGREGGEAAVSGPRGMSPDDLAAKG